ncbi:putative helicase mov-10-B.1 [Pholidichthys leucotaenia]
MPHLEESLESGLDFLEFLGDRISDKTKTQLRDIYKSEFRGREGIKDPTFCSVWHSLVVFRKVTVINGKVFKNTGSELRVYCDQWRKPRGPKESGGSSGSQTKAEASAAPLTSVLIPKKKMAAGILKKLKANRKELIADKGGIEITSEPVALGGSIHFTMYQLRELFLVRFRIENKGTNCIHFTFYTALHRIRCFTLEDERRVNRASPLFLCPGENYEVVVRYSIIHYGYFPTTMYFEFCPDVPDSSPFCIIREIEATAVSSLAEELGPVAPYKPYQLATVKPVNTFVVEGVPPKSHVFQGLKPTVILQDYSYDYQLKLLARQRLEDSENLSQSAKSKLRNVKSLLGTKLSLKKYFKRFSLLLHLEEIQMEVDIRKYDLRNENMTPDQDNRKLLMLQVPGVAENRPSVLRGDCLRVSKSGDDSNPKTVYTGYVHRVELDRVKLGFSQRLLGMFISNMKFDVEFTINRYPLKLQHRAVNLAAKHKLGPVLFPTGAAVATLPMPKLRMFNRQLESNPEQHAAVQRILAGSSMPAPHLVFGPPGTGKTVTLVEAMNQVCRADPLAHILACAPSNSACDLLCERLTVHMDRHQVYRMYASSRNPNSVPSNLRKYCNWDESADVFVFPKKKVLMEYKIIVTTLITAGRLVSGEIPVGHFSHIFVDEAGQALETECVIAIAGLLSPQKGQLVLAGDPKQLGPIIRSPFAIQYGLGLSLLERLMTENALYQESTDSGHFDTRFVTKLLRNYRSHESILKIPNEMFYKNELQVFADQWEREAYCKWKHLPKKGFPVIFHGVLGKDQRESNSPSFFNVSEIEIVVDYLTKLMETQGKKGLPKLSAKDVGIIAPYRKQVEKIQKALRSVPALKQWRDLKELKVGSVEEFQGQERKIIIVSTVRSCINYIKMDKDFNLGFLANEKRFNVAMTRAKSLLIVVGNPVILNKDPTWRKFITYCVNENAYTGFDFNDVEGEDEILTRLSNLRIDVDAENPAAEESPLQLYVDPGWKNEH